MYSGGLDSILAAKILADMGLRVIALHFFTGFNDEVARQIERGAGTPWTPRESVTESARKLGIELMPLDISGEEYREIMLNPRFGYGSGANPCIDCRIFLLEHARRIMEREGAILVTTGEVLGQRPMSQHRSALRQTEKRSGLTGRLLRPLSAKLLDPTIPETEGIIDRESLFDIQGRSRKRQQELAVQLGIDSYPSPGGGCVLTAVQFREKFFDLTGHMDKDAVTLRQLTSLLTGRHMRLPDGVKVIVGRNESENDFLEGLLGNDYWRFRARDYQGPVTYALDEPTGDDFRLISAITARYGKGLGEASVVVTADKGADVRDYTVRPATPEATAALLIANV